MKEKKKKEESTSSETPREKSPSGKGRLSGMIESMQKRGSPMSAHRVATRYFDSFRRERNIPEEELAPGPLGETPDGGENGADTVVTTAIDSAVKKRERKRPYPAEPGVKAVDLKDLDSGFTPSESRVYSAMYNKSIEKRAPTLRLGLKELRELTGLSDKTVRVAVHTLEKKLALKVVESSLGIYGRKFFILSPGEVIEERIKSGLEIDPTTKKVTGPAAPVNTAIDTAINTAVSNAVHTTVITAVYDDAAGARDKAGGVLSLYEFYTGNKRGDRDEAYFEKIKHLDPRVIEAALILAGLKGKGVVTEFAQVGGVLE
ncbi:MAG: hypothetical protein ACREOP_00335, partial [Thermodesulfobacteriota bacterium]